MQGTTDLNFMMHTKLNKRQSSQHQNGEKTAKKTILELELELILIRDKYI